MSPTDRSCRRAGRRGLRAAVRLQLFVTGLASTAAAQIGTTTDLIVGRVTGPDSQPIAGARVEITSLASGAVRRLTTRPDGRFSLLFREGGAQFRLTVTAIGRAPASMIIARRPDDDRVVADVRLNPTTNTLSAVQVRGRAARPGSPPASSAGGTEAIVGQGFLQRFPVLAGDLTNIVQIMPGVVGVAGGDSTPASFSVGGQPANQNNVTLDGASFLFGSLPQNAVRGVRLVTNAYDPSRGQFTGGQVATTTQAGSARVQGNLTGNLLTPGQQSVTATQGTFLQRQSTQLLSGGVGGPLVRDQAYWFAALDVDRRAEPMTSLLDADPRALANLGLRGDSLARFLALADARGLLGRAGAPATRETRAVSSLARLDWDLGTAHALTLRGDWRRTDLDATRLGGFALPSVAARSRADGGGLLATLSSSLGNFVNEARAYAAADRTQLDPLRAGPLGVVTIASPLADGRGTQAQVQVGGNPSLPRDVRNALVEVSNELSWLVGTGHRLKFGALVNASRVAVEGQGNQAGTYLYTSLDEFAADRPAVFARTLGGTAQRAGATTGALWLADAWRASPSLQFVYGARLEGTRLAGAPAGNPDVAQAVGLSTERFPRDWRVTPRVGFTWLLGNQAGIPAVTIKGGAGLFRGTVPAGLVAAAANGNGLGAAQQGLICAGDAVPAPDWTAFGPTPSLVPTQCVPGAPVSDGSRPTIIAFSPRFGAPEVWRASLGVTRQIKLRWAIAGEAVLSAGTRGVGAIDRNLGRPAFALANEGGRLVYSPATAVAPASGATSGNAGRPYAAFGPVLELGTGAQSRSAQVTVTLGGPSFRGGGTSLSYTYARVIDRANGFGLGAFLPNTAGDPNAFEWGTSDLERRHQLVGQQITPFPKGFELTVIGRVFSGSPYTPMVNGDVNGDGQRNDRAFVPTTTGGEPTAPAMAALLASTDPRAARCLRVQLGRVAGRNSCATPWWPQLDVQLNWKPPVRSLDDRLTLSLVATNTLAFVDRLAHGANIRGWGQPQVPDRTLLTVAGFDPTTRNFRYEVNRRFGTPTGTANPFAVPFQVALRVQYAVGVDQNRANLRALTGAGSRDSSSLASVKTRVLKQVPFLVDSLLKKADSLQLGLTAAQQQALTAEAARYRTAIDPPITAITAMLAANEGRPDLGAIGPKLQEQNLVLVRLIQQSLANMRAAVTPEQWAKI
nr:carboxypeptidase regulatory-like domain-containing protein [Gemmatimonadaceae bacterium]